MDGTQWSQSRKLRKRKRRTEDGGQRTEVGRKRGFTAKAQRSLRDAEEEELKVVCY
jgi:hypothetical protein